MKPITLDLNVIGEQHHNDIVYAVHYRGEHHLPADQQYKRSSHGISDKPIKVIEKSAFDKLRLVRDQDREAFKEVFETMRDLANSFYERYAAKLADKDPYIEFVLSQRNLADIALENINKHIKDSNNLSPKESE